MSFGTNQDSCWLQMMRKKHIIRYLKVNIISEVHIDQQRYVCWQGIGSNLQTNAELAMKKKKKRRKSDKGVALKHTPMSWLKDSIIRHKKRNKDGYCFISAHKNWMCNETVIIN